MGLVWIGLVGCHGQAEPKGLLSRCMTMILPSLDMYTTRKVKVLCLLFLIPSKPILHPDFLNSGQPSYWLRPLLIWKKKSVLQFFIDSYSSVENYISWSHNEANAADIKVRLTSPLEFSQICDCVCNKVACKTQPGHQRALYCWASPIW